MRYELTDIRIEELWVNGQLARDVEVDSLEETGDLEVIKEILEVQIKEVLRLATPDIQRAEREKIFKILDDYGSGDAAKGLTWLEFHKKYGAGLNSREPLVDILRQVLGGDKG